MISNNITEATLTTTDSITLTVDSSPIITTATSTIGTGTISYTPPKADYTLYNDWVVVKNETVAAKEEKEKKEERPIDKKIKELKDKMVHFSASSGIPYFSNIKEYVPNKVYEFSVKNYYEAPRKIKTICDESDDFNLEFAFFLAIIKYYYKGKYTPEGYVQQVKVHQYEKNYIKMVKYGMKLFELLKQKEKIEEEEKIRKEYQHKKYIAKKKARDMKRARDVKDNLYDIIKQAVIDSKGEI